MATSLTKTVNFVRRFLIITVLLLLTYFLFNFGLDLFRSLSPFGRTATTAKADVGFGQLPPLPFKSRPFTPKAETVTYTLETISGRLPNFPTLLPVFPVQNPKKSLLASERAKDLAATLGFSGQPAVLSPSEYLWEKISQKLQLRMNILTLNYNLTTTQLLPFIPGQLADEEKLKNTAQNFLSQARPLDKSFAESKTTVVWLRFNGQAFNKVESLSEADAARVDFFRTVMSGETAYPLLAIPPQESLVRAYFKGGQKDPYEVDFTVWPYDFEKSSTYPLKNVKLAWEELKKGQATVVFLNSKDINYSKLPQMPDFKNITIRNVQLAYFDDETRQSFLQPIYVFSGQADFKNGESAEIITYVPALDERWVVK